MKQSIFVIMMSLVLTSCYWIPDSIDEVDSTMSEGSCLEPYNAVQCYPNNLEFPEPVDGEDVITYCGFTSSYNHVTLIPNWVAYELTANEVAGQCSYKPSFSWDPNLKGSQASREDYSNSGWDKGHMAPRADMKWSEQSLIESYYFTNVCPQNHEMNAYDWCSIEKLTRRMASAYGSVYVICGPIITNNKYGTIGGGHVMVPDAFFKALLIYVDNEYHSIAFVVPNEPDRHPVEEYVCSVDELETMIGMNLFFNLDDDIEEIVESTVNMNFWMINLN